MPVEPLAKETPAKQHQIYQSPGKRKAPEDSALFSASKRKAILRGGLLPNVSANGIITGSQVAILKRGNGPVTVTPRRVLRPRLYTPKTEERELTESPEVEQVKREEVDYHSSQASSDSPNCSSKENCDRAAISAVDASPMLAKKAKKRKKRRSGLFKHRSDDYELLQETMSQKENTQPEKTPLSTEQEPTPKRQSLSRRLKRLSDSVFKSPARLVKCRSEDNMLSDKHIVSYDIGARLAGEDLSIGDSEDIKATYKCNSVSHPNESHSSDVQGGRGLLVRSASCHNFLAESSPTVHSVMEWIL
jgi:hypothetical protein